MSNRDLPPGIRRFADGTYQAYVWVPDATKPKGGYQASRRYPSSAAIADMKAWRNERVLRATHPELFVDQAADSTTFAEDARDYLSRDKVKKMPTAKERVRHIAEWVAIFGHRIRDTIEPHEIQKALDAMRAKTWTRTIGKKKKKTQTGTYSAGSVNKRRAALMDLWTTLDGRHERNPVKATTEYAEPEPEPRAPALAAVLRVLRAMPATKTRARLKVITWTGWPHAIVKKLDRADREYWEEGRAFVGHRRKGKGARARWLPLLPEAVKALREFHRADAYGWFSNSSMHKRVTELCVALKIARIRPYDFRHFFGTLIATLTQDERAVMNLMLLSTPAMVRRYTEAATDPRVQAAVADVAAQLRDLLKAAGRIGRVSPGRTRSKTAERGQGKRRKGRRILKRLVGAAGIEPATPAV